MENIDALLATLDDTIARILAEPSWAHRLAYATASFLDQQPTEEMDSYSLIDAVNDAEELVLPGIPGRVAGEALTALHNALPRTYLTETNGEYALRLRAVAKGL